MVHRARAGVAVVYGETCREGLEFRVLGFRGGSGFRIMGFRGQGWGRRFRV